MDITTVLLLIPCITIINSLVCRTDVTSPSVSSELERYRPRTTPKRHSHQQHTSYSSRFVDIETLTYSQAITYPVFGE